MGLEAFITEEDDQINTSEPGECPICKTEGIDKEGSEFKCTTNSCDVLWWREPEFESSIDLEAI